jgi:hypothetical protein
MKRAFNIVAIIWAFAAMVAVGTVVVLLALTVVRSAL